MFSTYFYPETKLDYYTTEYTDKEYQDTLARITKELKAGYYLSTGMQTVGKVRFVVGILFSYLGFSDPTDNTQANADLLRFLHYGVKNKYDLKDAAELLKQLNARAFKVNVHVANVFAIIAKNAKDRRAKILIEMGTFEAESKEKLVPAFWARRFTAYKVKQISPEFGYTFLSLAKRALDQKEYAQAATFIRKCILLNVNCHKVDKDQAYLQAVQREIGNLKNKNDQTALYGLLGKRAVKLGYERRAFEIIAQSQKSAVTTEEQKAADQQLYTSYLTFAKRAKTMAEVKRLVAAASTSRGLDTVRKQAETEFLFYRAISLKDLKAAHDVFNDAGRPEYLTKQFKAVCLELAAASSGKKMVGYYAEALETEQDYKDLGAEGFRKLLERYEDDNEFDSAAELHFRMSGLFPTEVFALVDASRQKAAPLYYQKSLKESQEMGDKFFQIDPYNGIKIFKNIHLDVEESKLKEEARKTYIAHCFRAVGKPLHPNLNVWDLFLDGVSLSQAEELLPKQLHLKLLQEAVAHLLKSKKDNKEEEIQQKIRAVSEKFLKDGKNRMVILIFENIAKHFNCSRGHYAQAVLGAIQSMKETEEQNSSIISGVINGARNMLGRGTQAPTKRQLAITVSNLYARAFEAIKKVELHGKFDAQLIQYVIKKNEELSKTFEACQIFLHCVEQHHQVLKLTQATIEVISGAQKKQKADVSKGGDDALIAQVRKYVQRAEKKAVAEQV